MKLSIVILCWNDLKVIDNCLRSIFDETLSTEFEVIVSDNGSTDGSIEHIRKNYPAVRVIENGRNLRFSKANNVGIQASSGKYVLILNPDTIIHERALDKMVAYADRHPDAGAIGCRVLNSDGTLQKSIRPFPSLLGEWIAALYLRPLGYLSERFLADTYLGWKGDKERTVDWLSGCCILLPRIILDRIGGFDERFFYFNEDTDLCRQVWQHGYKVVYTPEMAITHLGGQSTKHLPIGFALDGQVTRYRYYHKYYGPSGARHCRWISLTSLFLRRIVYRLKILLRPAEHAAGRLEILRVLFDWHLHVDPVRLIEFGEEPVLASGPLQRVAER